MKEKEYKEDFLEYLNFDVDEKSISEKKPETTVVGTLKKVEEISKYATRITMATEERGDVVLETNKKKSAWDFFLDRNITLIYREGRTPGALCNVLDIFPGGFHSDFAKAEIEDILAQGPSEVKEYIEKLSSSVEDCTSEESETDLCCPPLTIDDIKKLVATCEKKYKPSYLERIKYYIKMYDTARSTDEKNKYFRIVSFLATTIPGREKKISDVNENEIRKALDEQFPGQNRIKDKLVELFSIYKRNTRVSAPRIVIKATVIQIVSQKNQKGRTGWI